MLKSLRWFLKAGLACVTPGVGVRGGGGDTGSGCLKGVDWKFKTSEKAASCVAGVGPIHWRVL